MRRILLCLLVKSCLLTITTEAFSQKEGNIWYFGNRAGLDFSTGVPVPVLNGALNTAEGCATVCDANGILLFYTDGVTVYNKNHVAMQDGTGLSGHSSATQSAVIVPHPGNSNIYYIFTVNQSITSRLRYSTVDMTANGGLGRVASKNVDVLTNPGVQENICVIRGANMYWIVVQRKNTNTFSAYRLTTTGFNTSPVNTTVGMQAHLYSEAGYMKANLHGTKLAVAYYESNRTQVFDFDKITGRPSNPVLLTTYRNYGLEFSPSGQFLYAHAWGYGTYQYNLEAGNATAIQNSRVALAPARYEGAMQLAPDGKIYIANNGNNHISVISNPNELGEASNYSYASVSLGGAISYMGLPSIVHSILKVLPVNLLSFKAKVIANRTELEWKIEADRQHAMMILQRSGDGQRYSDIAEFAAEAAPAVSTYTYIDQYPLPGVNYYRLKQIDADGREKLLEVRMVKHDAGRNAYCLNSGAGSLTIHTPAELNSNYELLNIQGAVIRKGRMTGSQVSFNGLLPGAYIMRLQNNRKEALQVIVK